MRLFILLILLITVPSIQTTFSGMLRNLALTTKTFIKKAISKQGMKNGATGAIKLVSTVAIGLQIEKALRKSGLYDELDQIGNSTKLTDDEKIAIFEDNNKQIDNFLKNSTIATDPGFTAEQNGAIVNMFTDFGNSLRKTMNRKISQIEESKKLKIVSPTANPTALTISLIIDASKTATTTPTPASETTIEPTTSLAMNFETEMTIKSIAVSETTDASETTSSIFNFSDMKPSSILRAILISIFLIVLISITASCCRKCFNRSEYVLAERRGN